MKKIIVLTAVFALVFTGAAMAAEWNFYGNARMSLASVTMDKDMQTVLSPAEDWTTTSFDLQDNSRVGAKVGAGDVSANFEFGYFNAPNLPTGSKQAVRVRHLNATWNFGSGSMMVGQAWTPTTFFLANQVAEWDQGFYQYGAPALRAPQITFKFGGFQVGFLSPNATGVVNNAQAVLPKIEVAYNGAAGPVKFHVAGGYNSVNDVTTLNKSEAITSYMFNAMAKYAAGPFSIGGAFAYGINATNYDPTALSAVDAAGNWVGGKFKDNTAWAGQLVFGFTVNDMIGLEAGYAYVVGSDDGAKDDDTAQSYYFQVPLTLADGVFIIPEITVFDKMDSMGTATTPKSKQGKETWLGAKFQINF